MEQEMVLISKEQVSQMLTLLHRAEGYCANATSTPPINVPIIDEDPTQYYPGASGYAGATMRDVICTLESHLL
jgi:hypothetical protein